MARPYYSNLQRLRILTLK